MRAARNRNIVTGGAEYDREIRNLVGAIRKSVLAQQLSDAAMALMERMKQLKGQDFVYVALGHPVLKEDRIVFINQLGETLRRKEGLPRIRILPDDFALALIERETLGRLLLEDNKYQKDWSEGHKDRRAGRRSSCWNTITTMRRRN